MPDPFSRTRILIGDDSMARLSAARIAVFGVGGVGGYCVEALTRAGVGTLHLYDDDTVSQSNLNRQIVALQSTLGHPKAEIMAERVKDINPLCNVKWYPLFYLPGVADRVELSRYDYVIDCIDTVTAKLELAQRCHKDGIKLISMMGSGNKLDPTAFRVTDISKTSGCPLARIMRKELRKRGINHLKVVYSTEPPLSPMETVKSEPPIGNETRPISSARRDTPGSISFVPAAAGLVIASAVIREIGGF